MVQYRTSSATDCLSAIRGKTRQISQTDSRPRSAWSSSIEYLGLLPQMINSCPGLSFHLSVAHTIPHRVSRSTKDEETPEEEDQRCCSGRHETGEGSSHGEHPSFHFSMVRVYILDLFTSPYSALFPLKCARRYRARGIRPEKRFKFQRAPGQCGWGIFV